MKIAIIGAMREEIEPLLEKFDKYNLVEYGGNKYYEVRYGNLEIIIVYSKIGKVFATLTATILLEKFRCEMILFSGVAGALNSKLKIGDFVIASKVCQHDVDITKFGHEYGYIPESSVYIESDKQIRCVAKSVAEKLDISINEGIIATGDQFVGDDKMKSFIKNNFYADVLDMESGAVAVVCKNLDIPFFILRIISDTANKDADINFQEFINEITKKSAAFMFELIKELIKKQKLNI